MPYLEYKFYDKKYLLIINFLNKIFYIFKKYLFIKNYNYIIYCVLHMLKYLLKN